MQEPAFTKFLNVSQGLKIYNYSDNSFAIVRLGHISSVSEGRGVCLRENIKAAYSTVVVWAINSYIFS